MQLAGNVWPEDIDRSKRRGLAGVARKIREARVATEIEAAYPKDKILELYLNKIDLGNRAFGVQAAAERYFGKSASQLNVAEAAMLAAIPKAPTYYNPRRNPDHAVRRRNVVLAAMAANGAISPEEAETWKAYPLALSSRSDLSGTGEYFVEYVRQQMQARFGGELYEEGFRIYTTLDLDVQAAAERALATQLEVIENGGRGRFNHKSYREIQEERDGAGGTGNTTPYLQGAVIVMEANTGNILAMVGGRDFADSKFNRAVQALRQPGSTFKPFLFSAALERGISLEETFVDEPISIEMPDGQPVWEPRNYENKFTGDTLTLRQGLWKSVNTIAAQLGQQIGYEPIVEMARRFGITSRILPVPSITLGSPDVHPIEMVSAYTTFANLGTRTEPNAILRVEGADGEAKWTPRPVRHQVLDSAIAYLMTDALQGVVKFGSGNPEVWSAGFQLPSGGKTGTTNDYRSAWYIGFTHDVVVGVWIGFDDNRTIMPSQATGGRLAAPVFTQVMKEIYQRRSPPEGWREPEFMLVPVEIDGITGFRATPFCPRDAVEIRYYPPGGEPREYCPFHSPYGPGETD